MLVNCADSSTLAEIAHFAYTAVAIHRASLLLSALRASTYFVHRAVEAGFALAIENTLLFEADLAFATLVRPVAICRSSTLAITTGIARRALRSRCAPELGITGTFIAVFLNTAICIHSTCCVRRAFTLSADIVAGTVRGGRTSAIRNALVVGTDFFLGTFVVIHADIAGRAFVVSADLSAKTLDSTSAAIVPGTDAKIADFFRLTVDLGLTCSLCRRR